MQSGTSADRRERRVLQDMRQQSSTKYRGAYPDNNWQTRHATLKLTCSRMSRQWSSHSTGMIRSRRRVPVAVAFCIDCNLRSRVSSKPLRICITHDPGSGATFSPPTTNGIGACGAYIPVHFSMTTYYALKRVSLEAVNHWQTVRLYYTVLMLQLKVKFIVAFWQINFVFFVFKGVEWSVTAIVTQHSTVTQPTKHYNNLTTCIRQCKLRSKTNQPNL